MELNGNQVHWMDKIVDRYALESCLYQLGLIAILKVQSLLHAIPQSKISYSTLFQNSCRWCFRLCQEDSVLFGQSCYHQSFRLLELSMHHVATTISTCYQSSKSIFGSCGMRVEGERGGRFNRLNPARGQIARTYLYMESDYAPSI